MKYLSCFLSWVGFTFLSQDRESLKATMTSNTVHMCNNLSHILYLVDRRSHTTSQSWALKNEDDFLKAPFFDRGHTVEHYINI